MVYYDYIIIGGGASGLLLAYRMANDSFFDTKRILVLEKSQKSTNDRTWSFWEAPGGEFDALLFKQWTDASFKAEGLSRSFSMAPFVYKMIRSTDFYSAMHAKIKEKSHIKIQYDEVKAVVDKGCFAEVSTQRYHYRCGKVFTSVFDVRKLYEQEKYPVLQQHFLGWYIRTAVPVFDDNTITFMDFTVPQQGNTRFIYILPISATEALVEYTLFSKDLLTSEAYEQAIRAYLTKQNIVNYEIMEKEQGSIPMTCYDFSQHNSKRIFHIGTAGGWTKPSTGYTFLNTVRKTSVLITYLKKDSTLSTFGRKSRFWFYDLLLLDVLYRNNDLGSKLFSAIFRRNTPKRIFRFLDEKTNFLEELGIISALRPYPFLKSLFRRLF